MQSPYRFTSIIPIPLSWKVYLDKINYIQQPHIHRTKSHTNVTLAYLKQIIKRILSHTTDVTTYMSTNNINRLIQATSPSIHITTSHTSSTQNKQVTIPNYSVAFITHRAWEYTLLHLNIYAHILDGSRFVDLQRFTIVR